MARIYTSQTLIAGQTLELEPGPSRHLASALRLEAGDSFILFNGDGGEYAATIDLLQKKSVTAVLGERIENSVESPLSIRLGIALSKGDRFDWVIQKATELGVASISPLFTERTEVKLKGERIDKKLKHWRQIAISACEQCGRNRLPEIQSPQNIANWCTGELPEKRYVLHHRHNQQLEGNAAAPEQLALLIGPEGGLSVAEIELAESLQFTALSLGPRVLRTETAPIAAIAILQAQWGDMC